MWKGVIVPGSVIPTWVSLTDLMPTFLDAAGLSKPKDVHWDGTSFLSVLKHGHRTSKQVRHRDDFNMSAIHNRVFLWHKDTDKYRPTDDRINSAGYFDGLKVILRENGCLYRIFDMHHDPYEDANLAVVQRGSRNQCSSASISKYDRETLVSVINKDAGRSHCERSVQRQPGECLQKYQESVLERLLVIMNRLVPFVRHGKTARDNYNIEATVCDIPVASMPQRLKFSPDSCAAHLESCCNPDH
jgi:hypothetical protein